MVEQFVAQRTPDHLQKLYYKHSERKGPFTSRQERATKISYKYAPRENNQRIRVVEATARQRGGPGQWTAKGSRADADAYHRRSRTTAGYKNRKEGNKGTTGRRCDPPRATFFWAREQASSCECTEGERRLSQERK